MLHLGNILTWLSLNAALTWTCLNINWCCLTTKQTCCTVGKNVIARKTSSAVSGNVSTSDTLSTVRWWVIARKTSSAVSGNDKVVIEWYTWCAFCVYTFISDLSEHIWFKSSIYLIAIGELRRYCEYSWFNRNVVVNACARARTWNNQYVERGRHLRMRIMWQNGVVHALNTKVLTEKMAFRRSDYFF